VRRVPTAVVDQDQSALPYQLIRYAGAHPGLVVAGVSTRPEDAQALIWRGKAGGALFIPADFSRKVLAGMQPEVEVSGHGSCPLLNKVVLNGLAEVAGMASAGIERKRLGASTPSGMQAEAARQPLAVESLPLFVATNQMGACVHEVRRELAVLLGLALVFAVVGLVKRGRMPARR